MAKKEIKVEEKDLIAGEKYKLDRTKVKIHNLKDSRENEIAKANATHQLTVQRIQEEFEADLVEVERLRQEADEKRKRALTTAEVALQKALDRIEAKY
jgi:hypothetical protein